MQDAPIEICKQNTANKSPSASVIWLHGLGADGHDFAPVVEMLNLAHIRFILPHAPYLNITRNNGYEMRAWYDIIGLVPGAQEDALGIKKTQAYVEKLIAQENARGIASNRIVIAGFSQGGAMALYTALRHHQALAGVLALSTYLPLKQHLSVEKSSANQNTPIFMAHGNADNVITMAFCQASVAVLQAQQYALDWHEYAMAHSVCGQEIEDIRSFLQGVLPA